MRVLEYSDLDTTGLVSRYQKCIRFLEQGDFNSADVKKLCGTPYYRAKLDDTNRVLFQFLNYQGRTCLLILEIIRNHDYDNSRFLKNGAKVDEKKIDFSLAQETNASNATSIHYIHPERASIHFLDRFLSFDDPQDLVYQQPLPVILIGSAGSGKTVLTLEKMKTLEGNILYITHSAYLVENTERLYYANHYNNDKQELTFYTFWNLLESIHIPQGREIDLKTFSHWFNRQSRPKSLKDPNKAFEEMKGVITGSTYTQAYLNKEDYLNLGIKQSIFLPEEREAVYELFIRYLSFLKESQRFDSNILSYDYLAFAKPTYDYIVIDEVQDFTNAQLYLILHVLNNSKHLMLCGDANQIVHPNFFSWSKLKSLFYHSQQDVDIAFFLTKNYRNTPEVTALANKLLRLKNLRFGSIDKESHYLVESHTTRHGEVICVEHTPEVLKELNDKTGKSTQFAVIVLDEESKVLARQHFKTPLIFSVQEAKGLEYDNIILYNFISHQAEVYREISRDVGEIDENTKFEYHRAKDKTDKSLEIYKFYINALYVGMTRAIASIYWVEADIKHGLIRALQMNRFQATLSLVEQQSSLEDWQKEAQKLERQGKEEQVDAIKQNILHQEKPKWAVLTQTDYQVLKDKFSQGLASKDEKLSLLEYSLVYDHRRLVTQLANSGFKPALRLQQAKEFLIRKYFTFYESSNYSSVLREITRFGVDFRNPFNQTPLLIAVWIGNEKLATELMTRGANVSLTDNHQRDAFRLLLANVYFGKKNAVQLLSKLYDGLNMGSLSLQVDDKLIKLGGHLMEFFLVNLLLAVFPAILGEYPSMICFGTDVFIKQIQAFPENVLAAYRKKRPYLSSILSKNEINSSNPYNRKLFMRYKQGYYFINPELQIRVKDQDDWINIYTFMGLAIPLAFEDANYAGSLETARSV